MPSSTILWPLLILATLTGCLLIRRATPPAAKTTGIALIALTIATLTYASYQIAANFRANDLTALAILLLTPSGILCLKKAKTPQTRELGIALLHLSALLTIYIACLIILALSRTPA